MSPKKQPLHYDTLQEQTLNFYWYFERPRCDVLFQPIFFGFCRKYFKVIWYAFCKKFIFYLRCSSFRCLFSTFKVSRLVWALFKFSLLWDIIFLNLKKNYRKLEKVEKMSTSLSQPPMPFQHVVWWQRFSLVLNKVKMQIFNMLVNNLQTLW